MGETAHRGAHRLWSDHGEATRPGPSGWQLPLPVPPAFPCHFGYQNSPGTPITKLEPPYRHYRVGTRKGAQPRARLSQGRGRSWAFCGSCSLGPSTQRLSFSCPDFAEHMSPLHPKEGLWVPSLRGRSKWRGRQRPWGRGAGAGAVAVARPVDALPVPSSRKQTATRSGGILDKRKTMQQALQAWTSPSFSKRSPRVVV